MYGFLLVLHNVVRSAVLAAGAYALLRALLGWRGRRPWSAADPRAGAFVTVGLDLQFLSGVALALVSPVVRAAVSDLAAMARMADLRFFPLVHVPLMLAALAVAHTGRVWARRAGEPHLRHRRTLEWLVVALGLVLAAMPWWRPLLRGV
jgi:hypothetical protein